MTLLSKLHDKYLMVIATLSSVVMTTDVFANNLTNPLKQTAEKAGYGSNYSAGVASSLDTQIGKTSNFAGIVVNAIFGLATIVGAIFTVLGVLRIIRLSKEDRDTAPGWYMFGGGVVLMAIGALTIYFAGSLDSFFGSK